MSTGRNILFAGLVLLAAAAIAVIVMVRWAREGRQTTQELQAALTTLRDERDRLRPRVIEALPKLKDMPDRELRVGIPTILAADLVTRFVAAVPEHLTLELSGMRVRRQGKVRRLVPLGDFDLNVNVTRVSARFSTGEPALTFGGNRLGLVLPVQVTSGTGSAAIDFLWDGRSVGGAVCGDRQVKEVVTGTVRPAAYRVSGALELTRTDDAIVLSPRFPPHRIRVRVIPSKASWAAVQRVLDEPGGLCGFVLDRVNIRGTVENLLATGFVVRLPTERLRPFALPVGIASTLTIRGLPVKFSSTGGRLTITENMIWVGANVTLAALKLPR